jgi:hypothetical protein
MRIFQSKTPGVPGYIRIKIVTDRANQTHLSGHIRKSIDGGLIAAR